MRRPSKHFATVSAEVLESRVLMSNGSLDMLPAENAEATAHAGGCCCPGCLLQSATEFSATAEPATAANIPALSSLPGSPFTIYLDFDGHTTRGTSWNSRYNGGADIVSPAYFDAGQIEAIWQRVAEDFAPFAVNVTTVDPGSEALRRSGIGDTAWGVRVILTADQSWLADDLGFSVGGVAYTGSFTWSTDTPVFVFNAGEVYAAETASHEAGHALGLTHDGTNSGATYYYGHGSGPTGWNPIMGAGFGRELSQWSKGEYPDANQWQDDLRIITTNNGFGYRVDDHGDTPETATLLDGLFASGIIERNTDVDLFAIDLKAGTLTLDAKPFERGPNLDILLELLDANGNVIASSNPVDRLDASLTATVAAGRYYIRIDGVGKAANGSDYGYSDYGSLGQYTISGTLSEAPPEEPELPPAEWWFDFGSPASPVENGYTKVDPTTTYSPSRGYGWSEIPGGYVRSETYTRPGLSDLTRDYTFTRDATFTVDLPNGTYAVTVTIGDPVWSHDYQGVYLQGELVDSITIRGGGSVTRSYAATVTDGRLMLRMRDLGGHDPHTVINALVIKPLVADPPSPLVPMRYDFGRGGSISDGHQEVLPWMTYHPSKGFGWTSGSIGSETYTKPGLNDLSRDYNYTKDGTFAVDLENGSYRVTLTFHDPVWYHDRMGVYLEGELRDDITINPGELVERTYLVSVFDGQLTLTLRDLGGIDPHVVINAMTIERV